MNKKRLITAALPYVNNAPHLGNIIGSVLSADVFARFCRMRGYETLYVCGTDGYGTATETKAKAEGLTPAEICDRYHKIHTEIYEFFNIKFDAFGKTFSPGHGEVVQAMYRDLDSQGFLTEAETQQTYCRSCATFLADRYVEGSCPHCGSEHARGDQCEDCGKLLEPKDLINFKCAVCGNVPELRSTTHLYLKLPELSGPLQDWLKNHMTEGKWTSNARTTTEAWLKRGLIARPITRDLKWGVSVPKQGYESKVFYVWFDAPIGYISITKEYFPDQWEDWWLKPESTQLYQFIGKDNIPFHSVIFPATLLGSKKDWTMVHHLNSTEFLNYENMKFSKSKGVGIFGTDVMDLDFPIDLWRFHLIRTRPERQDANFLWEEFFDKVNGELIDIICNLINRVLVYQNKSFPGPIATVSDFSNEQTTFVTQAKEYLSKVTTAYEDGELREAMRQIILASKLANRFFQEQEPWKTIKADPENVKKTLVILIHFVRDIAGMLAPVMPETSAKIGLMVGVPELKWSDLGDYHNLSANELGPVQLLFNKLEPKQLRSLKSRFGDDNSGFETLDVRVGHILTVTEHPAKDHLFVESVDMGDGKILSIVSAFRKNYQAQDLTGKRVLVLVNLAAADFAGVKSEGMILAAQKGKKMELLSDDSWPIGARVYRKGFKISATPPTLDFKAFLKLSILVENHQLTIDGDPLLVADGAKELALKTQLLPKAVVK